ncbi:hypothetical protein ACE193_15185 [Bernardetia sp. OM2101]|uniref:hypothetical protein n=1 Tax=Bernardetia sp. OM2101 TaxID=3344876 RepID=UPI0035CF7D6D
MSIFYPKKGIVLPDLNINTIADRFIIKGIKEKLLPSYFSEIIGKNNAAFRWENAIQRANSEGFQFVKITNEPTILKGISVINNFSQNPYSFFYELRYLTKSTLRGSYAYLAYTFAEIAKRMIQDDEVNFSKTEKENVSIVLNMNFEKPKQTEDMDILLPNKDPVAIANETSNPIGEEAVVTAIDIFEGNNSLSKTSLDKLIAQENAKKSNSTATYSDVAQALSLEEATSNKSSKKWWIAGAVVGIAAVGGGGYYYYQKKKKKPKSKTTKK